MKASLWLLLLVVVCIVLVRDAEARKTKRDPFARAFRHHAASVTKEPEKADAADSDLTVVEPSASQSQNADEEDVEERATEAGMQPHKVDSRKYKFDDHDESLEEMHKDDAGAPEKRHRDADGVDGERDGHWTMKDTHRRFGTFGRRVKGKQWDGQHNDKEMREHHLENHRRRRDRAMRDMGQGSHTMKMRRQETKRKLHELRQAHVEKKKEQLAKGRRGPLAK